MSHAGFDRADCPDLAMMRRLRVETNLCWCGYYLRAPSQPAPTWRGKRADLAAMGWGLAPIFVGQQIAGPGSHLVTATQGDLDGGMAAAQMFSEGFPAGSWVYLDLENGPPMPDAQAGYVSAWIDRVNLGRYRAGVYCSFMLAARIRELRPAARLWVFHISGARIAAHPVAGSTFSAPDPMQSGFPGAAIWQHDDEARLTAFGDLACDLDSALVADPGAPDLEAHPPPRPSPAPPSPARWPPDAPAPATAAPSFFAKLWATITRWFATV